MVAAPGPTAVSSELPLPGKPYVRDSATATPGCFFAKPEVKNFDQALAPAGIDDKQVGRLNVPVDDPLGMRSGQSRRCLLAERDHLVRGQSLSARLRQSSASASRL